MGGDKYTICRGRWAIERDLPRASAFSARKRQSDILLKIRRWDQAVVLRIKMYMPYRYRGECQRKETVDK